MVKDSYDWFRDLAKNRRHLDDAGLERVADGWIFTGRQGVPLKLGDELGDEQTAIAWLAKENNIDPTLPVRDYRLRDRFTDLPFLHTAAVALLEAEGLRPLAERIEASNASIGSTLTVSWRFGTFPLGTSFQRRNGGQQ
jgi:protease-4